MASYYDCKLGDAINFAPMLMVLSGWFIIVTFLARHCHHRVRVYTLSVNARTARPHSHTL
jgi:hypothetical protein